MVTSDQPPLILITGATGYIGGRLLRALESRACRIRCLARRPEFLAARVHALTQVVAGDLLDPASLEGVMADVHTAFYLVHSMSAEGGFEENDRQAASNFAAAAKAAGVRRIVYLGGLGRGSDLSPHLRSRQEVGEILRSSGIPTIEFRASVVIGSGSLSFEMIRALTERLPVMVTPSWVGVKAQPIAIEDVISYLTAAIDLPAESGTVIEIGGPDIVSYAELMQEYAHQRHLKRLMIPVPVLTPRLSSLWLGLVTPLYARVGRKLIDSIKNETLADSTMASRLFVIRPMGVRAAISRALKNEDDEFAETRWSDALAVQKDQQWGGVQLGSRLVDSREIQVDCHPQLAFQAIARIGGATGWYYADFLWQLRGFLDLLVGGAGLRRGRRDPNHLRVGDTLDFWRVETVEAGRLLRLASEMKLPGRAWLQFEVEPSDAGCKIRQIAIFDPVGVAGLMYWYGLYFIHQRIFSGMLAGIAKAGKGFNEPKTFG